MAETERMPICKQCVPGVWECGNEDELCRTAEVPPWKELGEIVIGGDTYKVFVFPPAADAKVRIVKT